MPTATRTCSRAASSSAWRSPGRWPRSPALMLLDEPFSSLDACSAPRSATTRIALLRTAGTPVLMVTHDAEEAVRVADRIHAMQDGRMLQNGTPAELYAHPANPFVAGFFGPLNRYKGWVVGGMVSTPLGSARGRRSGRRHGGRRADPARGRAAAPRRRRGAPAVPGAADSRPRHQPRPGARAARRAAGDRAHDQHRRVRRRATWSPIELDPRQIYVYRAPPRR